MLVGFAHYSVKEFLISDRIKTSNARKFSLDRVHGRVYLTTIDLTYLTSERYKSESYRWRSIHPIEDVLYVHAAHEWISHATDLAVEAQIIPHALQLLTATGSNHQLLIWQSVTHRSGESAFCTAIKTHLLLIAEQLLKAGADPNAPSRMEKETPLAFAGRNRRTRAINVLLRGGADPHAADIYGQSP